MNVHVSFQTAEVCLIRSLTFISYRIKNKIMLMLIKSSSNSLQACLLEALLPYLAHSPEKDVLYLFLIILEAAMS